MVYSRIVTPEEINAAQAAGWRVNDLNTPVSSVRGPNWVLTNPEGKVVKHGWTASDAWQGLAPEPEKQVVVSAIQRVMAERARQDAKWGEQNHEPGKWLLILAEELGEVAKSQLEGDRANYIKELVQSAAVLVAWIECELRNDHAR
jgi:NTP pyrophosphatase (non-canonical NTP hydrolase)